jgi:hypothetical protein
MSPVRNSLRFFRKLKHIFIPHEGNEYQPHLLRHESVFLLFFVVIIFELGFLIQVFVVFDQSKFLAAVLPGVLTTLTNEARAENNAPLLVESSLLNRAAELKAQDMATRGYFAHTSPDGLTPWHWLNQVGYRYSSAGENLAVNFFESSDVTLAWMNSPTHRANILKNDFTEIGIGVASGVYQGRNTIFVAQFFGRPARVAQVAPLPEPSPALPTPEGVGTPTSPEAFAGAAPSPVLPTPEVAGTQPLPVEDSINETVPAEAEKAVVEVKENPIRVSFEKTLSSPRRSMGYLYGGLAALVFFSLLLMFFVRAERRHPAFLARGAALFAVVLALLFVNLRVLPLETKVPTDLSANVIETLR